MIKKVVIEIDGINYTLPEVITVSHYGEMMRRMSLSDDMIDKAHDVIGVLLGIPYTILRELDKEKMTELSLYLQNKVTECEVEYIPSFKFKDVKYGGLVLNKMTFGEYIDILSLMKDELSIYININKICSILYRPEISKGKIKPYDLDEHEEQSIVFQDLPLKYFFGAFKNLFSYLNQTRKDFVVLFGEEDDQPPIQYDEDDNKIEEEKSNLPWYKMIMTLTNEDFTKIDYVTGRSVVECFNHLTYIKIKNEDLKQQALQQQNKMNLL